MQYARRLDGNVPLVNKWRICTLKFHDSFSIFGKIEYSFESLLDDVPMFLWCSFVRLLSASPSLNVLNSLALITHFEIEFMTIIFRCHQNVISSTSFPLCNYRYAIFCFIRSVFYIFSSLIRLCADIHLIVWQFSP